jgi:hypothetical protein
MEWVAAYVFFLFFFEIILSRVGVTMDLFWIDDRIYVTL